eukprot:CAMPEP_0119282384 /NCGR_PEP_ID=MMETSP1329-20130426/26608_1 /TAXON_ID=114041 /ORGANISM="Genus nov. species nov., Strain RCC1024" /LENGTH=125 /DNA_ID=CAMNT_0007283041 /DNA_START=500 /DNA_END=874 /DNA_ORIENTATION=-
MGFSNVTGKARPKRPGCETKKERDKRKKRQGDEISVKELRTVKKQKGEAAAERAPAGLKRQKGGWEKKLAALLKTNEAIKALRAKQEAGAALDAQQLQKLARGDEVLLSLNALIEERPDEAERFM